MADRHDTKKHFGNTLNPDGTLRAVSQSQVQTFLLCPMKWHFEKKGGLPRKPQGKGAAKGDAAHGRMEKWLKTGADVRGPLELVGAKMIEPYLWAAPFNKGPGLVEGPLLDPRIQTPGGILITGYFDFYIPGANGHEGTGLEWPIIIDHKFKKNLEQYGITEDELAEDPQTLIYGAWVLAREPNADGVVTRHHQHQTEGTGGMFPEPVEARLTRDDLLKRWGKLSSVIDTDMCATARVPAAGPGQTPEGVAHNDVQGACGAFGGCDFAATCRFSPMNKFKSYLSDASPKPTDAAITNSATPNQGFDMALLFSTPSAPVPSTPQTAPAMVAALKESIAQPLTLAQAKPGTVYLVPPNASPARLEIMLGDRAIFRAKDGGLCEVKADQTVRPVDEETLALFEGRASKPAAPAVVSAPPVDVLAEKKRKLGIVDVPGEGVTPPDAAPPSQPAPAQPPPPPAPVVQVATAEAVEPKKRGRKPKGETDAPAVPAPAPEPAPEVDSTNRLMLLVNCSSRHAQDLAGYVKAICDTVATELGAPDVRLAHKNSDGGFGGWKALLAMKAAKAPPAGLCSICSGELSDPIIEALVPLASVVVYPRGVR